MVTMLIFYRRQKELDIFKKLGKELFARLSEDQLELRCFSASSGMMEYLRQGPLVDLFCAGITGPEEITLLRRVRRMYEKADFLLIADDTISPMEYLVPGVRASSLLLYPYRGGGNSTGRCFWNLCRTIWRAGKSRRISSAWCWKTGKAGLSFRSGRYIISRSGNGKYLSGYGIKNTAGTIPWSICWRGFRITLSAATAALSSTGSIWSGSGCQKTQCIWNMGLWCLFQGATNRR